MNEQKITILYERLSVEDDRNSESNSIANQRELLSEYAERNDFVPYVHISDDGYSGTNWDRPGWQELIARIDSGEVSNLLVKDSSRLGRDHLRVGLFREMLHDNDIRLIAVNDGFDSANGEDDFTPFRDIMAEWYARDASRKVRSTLHAKGHKGIPLSSRPPYGYIKDPNDNTHWLIDEFAAEVVRRIFDFTIAGITTYEICQILHDEKTERPSYYLTKNGYSVYNGVLEMEDPYAWLPEIVRNILHREEYLGHVVNFRCRKPSFKSKKMEYLPKEEWVIFENVHEPIIEQETWDLAQRLCKTARRLDKYGYVSPLTGLLFCATCNSKMHHHRSKKNKHDGYECAAYANNRNQFAKDVCSPHCVSTKALREIILETIRKTASFVQEQEEEFVAIMRNNSTLVQKNTIKTHTHRIAMNERRIETLEKMHPSLYEDRVNGIITAERFSQMSAGFEQEQSELIKQNEAMRLEIEVFNEDNQRADNFVSLAQRYTRFEELTTPMINEFVDKIVVHSPVWSEATETNCRLGTRTQQIDVYLKYIGRFEIPDKRTPEEIEAERIAEEKLEAIRKKQRDYMRMKRARRLAEEERHRTEFFSPTSEVDQLQKPDAEKIGIQELLSA